MARLITSMMKPKNASCAWSTDCNFWRNGGTCFDTMILQGSPTIIIGWRGVRLGKHTTSGGPVLDCGVSDTYFTQTSNSTVKLNIWKALADGVWSSSVSIPIYITNTVITTATVVAGMDTGITPGTLTLAGCPARSAASCAAALLSATVTVYDDGTFTLT